MKTRNAFSIGGAVLSCMVLASCGGDRRGAAYMPPVPPPQGPPPQMTMNLDTAAVLAIVRTMTSDSADPFEVDGGAVAVIPMGDETSAPISVDAT